jgi:hypothetical protein
MTVEGREYFKCCGFVYHPAYISVYCDNEAQDIAQMIGKYMYVGDEVKIFKHIHPSFGLAPEDKQYRHTQSFFPADRLTYLTRKKKNFYIV